MNVIGMEVSEKDSILGVCIDTKYAEIARMSRPHPIVRIPSELPDRRRRCKLDGYKEGSFCMTLGYPGSTERYLSSYGIEEMMNVQMLDGLVCSDAILPIIGTFIVF